MAGPAGEDGRGVPVLVVSGLPRSGTSLAMQMLAAAGVPLLVDEARPADASNPRGYFELAAVKAIRRDRSFLDGAGGRAVKIVAPLLPFLPRDRDYRIVFMTRSLDEVLRSQARMLERDGVPAGTPDDARLAEAFEGALAAAGGWIARHSGAACLEVDHAALLAEPRSEARRIAAFLGLGDESVVEAMAAAVDPALHRSRRV